MIETHKVLSDIYDTTAPPEYLHVISECAKTLRVFVHDLIFSLQR